MTIGDGKWVVNGLGGIGIFDFLFLYFFPIPYGMPGSSTLARRCVPEHHSRREISSNLKEQTV